jgi:beta-glucosidase
LALNKSFVLACPNALEAAEKSIMLMQNNHAILPFDKTKIKKVLAVGKLAKSENIGDHASSQVWPEYIVTPFEGLMHKPMILTTLNRS